MFPKIFLTTFALIALSSHNGVQSQYLSTDVDDKTYFDNVQYEIEGEVEEAKEILIDQAKVVEVATRNFAASKLKQNFFKALRYLAEKELESISMHDRLRQPRQEGDDDGGEGDDSDSTTRRTVPLIPVLANILKAVFGDNSTLNLTNQLQAASKFVFRPIQSQITGITNLLGFNKPIPDLAKVVRETDEIPNHSPAKTAKKDAETGSAEEIVLVIPDFLGLENPTDATNLTTSANGTTGNGANSTTSSLNTQESEGGVPGVIYIDVLAKDIQASLDGLLKAVPDLFKGAKEALTLLQSLREIYDP